MHQPERRAPGPLAAPPRPGVGTDPVSSATEA